MKSNKYKIVVLLDLKKSPSTTLISAVSLAKMINANINVFYVKKPTDIVETESQLSAYRTINEQHSATKKSIENLVNSVSKTDGVEIDYSYKFGNVKNEIGDYIAKQNPDIIVLGKRNSSPMNFMSDNISDYILKTHKGIIMIVGNEHSLEPNQELSIGLLNSQKTALDTEFEKALLANTQKPLKTFRFLKNAGITKETRTDLDTKTVDYVFEHNENMINNLSNYLSISNINMLYINRINNSKTEENLTKSEMKEVINKLNISLLLSGE